MRRSRSAGLVVGNGLDPTTEMGPLISRRHCDRVAGYVERAVDAGAVLECGGPCDDPELQSGCSYKPTILSRVSPDMEVWREEVFGPVLVVASFDDEDEAVALANDSAYGLAASIWTRDVYRTQRLVRAPDVRCFEGRKYLPGDRTPTRRLTRRAVHESKSVPRAGEARQHHGICAPCIALRVDYAPLAHLKSADHLTGTRRRREG